jgi:hypothetical protein
MPRRATQGHSGRFRCGVHRRRDADYKRLQLAKRIHAIKPALPVIYVTGYANIVGDREHCDMLVKKRYGTATLAAALAKVQATSHPNTTPRTND